MGYSPIAVTTRIKLALMTKVSVASYITSQELDKPVCNSNLFA